MNIQTGHAILVCFFAWLALGLVSLYQLYKTAKKPLPAPVRLSALVNELAAADGKSSTECFDVLTADNQLVSVHRADCPHARIKVIEKLIETDLNDGVPMHDVVERLKSIGVVASMIPMSALAHDDSDTDPSSFN